MPLSVPVDRRPGTGIKALLVFCGVQPPDFRLFRKAAALLAKAYAAYRAQGQANRNPTLGYQLAGLLT
jgi:hypothetical protein